MDHVRVIYHHEQLWWAESPDVRDWRAEAQTYEELHHLVIEQIPFVLDRAVTLDHSVAGEQQADERTADPHPE